MSRQGELRQRLADKRQNLKRSPRAKKNSDWRRWWSLAILLLLLLLGFVRECSCNEPGLPEDPILGPETPDTGEAPPVRIATPLPDLKRMDRPEYESTAPKSPPWIGAFRMQVAARSPRLAECFVGARQPGRLKWTTSVEPASGLVSEHSLVPMLLSDELSRGEYNCVFEVLSDPPYKLVMGDEKATPSRVGLVIEF